MKVTLSAELEVVLKELARRQGVTPESLALDALREHFLTSVAPIQPQDEWERRLLAVSSNCGVSLSHSALGSEELYE